MNIGRSIGLISLCALSALAACDQDQPSGGASSPGQSPTSNASNASSSPPSQQQIRKLARQVERGDAKACSNQNALNVIMSEGIGRNPFNTAVGWTEEKQTSFYETFTSDVRGIVFNGKDASSKTIFCAATYYVTSENFQFSGDFQYEMQVTLDGEVITRVNNIRDLRDVSLDAINNFWHRHIYGRTDQPTTPPPSIPAREASPPPPFRAPPPPAPRRSASEEDRVEVNHEKRPETISGPPVITPTPPQPTPLPTPSRPSVTSNPRWSRAPQPQFPDQARERGVEAGSASLSCTAQPNGSLSNCQVISESPNGVGFGQAALQSTSNARLASSTVDGLATGGSVRFMVRFRGG